MEEADEPVLRNWRGEAVTNAREADEDKTIGFRAHGKSKDSRDDLPQIVIGMAVTREGIPVRVWCWPGNTGDQGLIRQVKDDMRDWSLGRVVWVTDRGFSSGENRRYLQRGAGKELARLVHGLHDLRDVEPVGRRGQPPLPTPPSPSFFTMTWAS